MFCLSKINEYSIGLGIYFSRYCISTNFRATLNQGLINQTPTGAL